MLFRMILAAGLLVGCTPKGSESVGPTHRVAMAETTEDLYLPSGVWALADDLVPVPVGALEGQPPQEAQVRFLPATVILEEKNPGVLTHPRLELNLQQGGGEIDLSQFTTGMIGSFRIKVELPTEFKREDLRVVYVSQARKRKLDDRVWGAGCKTYMQVETLFNETFFGPEGFTVNTHRDRHLTVVGGHFIIMLRSLGEILVTRISFTDSVKGQYFCREN